MSSLFSDAAFYFDENEIEGITLEELCWLKDRLHLAGVKYVTYAKKVILVRYPLKTGKNISEATMKYIERGAVPLQSIGALAVCAYVPNAARYDSRVLRKAALEVGLDNESEGDKGEQQLPLPL